MSEAVDYPDHVNGHRIYRRQQQRGGDRILASYQCMACGAAELSYQSFNAYGCPHGGDSQ